MSVLSHLDNSSYYKYELQQSFYKYILEKDYGIKLQSPAQGKEIFKSIRTMAEYIQQHRTK